MQTMFLFQQYETQAASSFNEKSFLSLRLLST